MTDIESRDDYVWHRRIIAGPSQMKDHTWDRYGMMQVRFMRRYGLRPTHKLLELGCGALRAGAQFIRFLEPGNYYGYDKEQSLIDAGVKHELPRVGVQEKNPHFFTPETVHDLEGVQVDYVWSVAVFIHAEPEAVREFLAMAARHLVEDGSLYATFHPSGNGKINHGRPLDKHNAFRQREFWSIEYPQAMLEEWAASSGLEANYIGAWGHEANKQNRQMMMEFIKRH